MEGQRIRQFGDPVFTVKEELGISIKWYSPPFTVYRENIGSVQRFEAVIQRVDILEGFGQHELLETFALNHHEIRNLSSGFQHGKQLGRGIRHFKNLYGDTVDIRKPLDQGFQGRNPFPTNPYL